MSDKKFKKRIENCHELPSTMSYTLETSIVFRLANKLRPDCGRRGIIEAAYRYCCRLTKIVFIQRDETEVSDLEPFNSATRIQRVTNLRRYFKVIP